MSMPPSRTVGLCLWEAQRTSAASVPDGIDHLALVDPVQVEPFWVDLHGDGSGLCGLLRGHTGVSTHV